MLLDEMVSEQKQSSTRELEHEMNEREHLTDDTQVLQKEYSGKIYAKGYDLCKS